MTFYIDLDLLRIVDSLAVRRTVKEITVRRGDTPTILVKFCRNGAVVDPGIISLFFVVKDTGKYDQNPPLVLTGPFTKTGTGASAVWSALGAFSTELMDDLLFVDNNDANDLPYYEARAEFSWTAGASTSSTEAFICTIENDLYRSGDTPPVATIATGFPVYLSGVTSLTGGLETSLDGVPTTTTIPPAIVDFILPGVAGYQKWWLIVWTAEVEDGIGTVLPDDFNSGTNAKVWIRIA